MNIIQSIHMCVLRLPIPKFRLTFDEATNTVLHCPFDGLCDNASYSVEYALNKQETNNLFALKFDNATAADQWTVIIIGTRSYGKKTSTTTADRCLLCEHAYTNTNIYRMKPSMIKKHNLYIVHV